MTDKNSGTDSVAFRVELDSTNNSIEELQTKIAFQEHTIEALNEALSSQQQQLGYFPSSIPSSRSTDRWK